MSAIPPREASALLRKLPEFEMFYETIQHKTFSAGAAGPQHMTLHIPMGRKSLLWLTHYERDVGFVWVELGPQRKYGAVSWQKAGGGAPLPWFYGTLLYGTRTQDRYYIEDIYRFQGFPIDKYTQAQKWGAIRAFLGQFAGGAGGPRLMVPVMNGLCIPDYPVYSIQTRSLAAVGEPYIHYRGVSSTAAAAAAATPTPEMARPAEKRTKKPQYGEAAVFRVMAEPFSDLYKLFAYGPGSSWIFYDYACIQTPAASRAMNRIFRRIRENVNIDLIEESDDEADEPVAQFTDCKKQVLMKCVFNRKWRKWEPVCQVADRTRATHISAL